MHLKGTGGMEEMAANTMKCIRDTLACCFEIKGEFVVGWYSKVFPYPVKYEITTARPYHNTITETQ